jgi:glycosyltransferase involved in cell wall biosynthesis
MLADDGIPNLISMIVPVGPVNRWLADAVRSTLDQRLPADWSLELLIAVDGIPESLEAARKLATDPRVGIVYLHENSGPYIAQNAALDRTRGSLIGVLGADDVMCQGRLFDISSAMSVREIAMVNTLVSGCDEYLTPHYVHKTADGVWVVRRSLMQKLGGWRPWRCSADTDLLLRARALGAQTHTVQKALYLARQHVGQLTRDPSTAMGSGVRQAYIDILKADYERYKAGEVPERVEMLHPPHTVEGPLFC